jgi:ribosome-binding protein aMBF1 (putative translation factor)
MRTETRLIPAEDLLAERLGADAEFAARWARRSVARLVAIELVRLRARRGLSQRDLAEMLGVSQPRVAELEDGEKAPTIETLARISATTGIEFAISVTAGGEPRIARTGIAAAPAHTVAGAAVRAAARQAA